MDEIDTTELLARLLAVMPPCWLDKLAVRLTHLCADTGHGDVTIVIYRSKVVQINEVIKDR